MIDWTLTEAEREVMDLVVAGRNRKEIADDLGISHHTIKFHIMNVFRKMRVNSIVTAALYYDRKMRAA